ncbi:MxaK protein [Methylocella tundrae]|uniref:MxaK protein, involved in methanol oxidation n=1 Tax=Methylocella tundrae TaxID=227605 RepID=A0A4V6IML5_METTU|nr:MxaK protein [Methylocella tundrae]WPP05940.1 MxaK protein [Methylocella tundrae]VFU08496.1 MxaK protein, involved in methanol oxidation [Methylocella tundrae]
MSLSFNPVASSRADRARRADWRRTAARFWGQSRPHLLMLLPIAFALIALSLVGMALRFEAANATIRALKENHDVAVAIDSPPEILLARIEFLLGHDRVDEIQPYVEALDKTGSDALKAIAHYDFANGRLRQAFELLTQGKLDAAGPFVVLSRQEYRRALALAPGDWDAKFNLDVASRLIRDFPAFRRTIGDAVKTDRKKIWTDIPGKPEGLP